ncbi:E3 ubiquitin-protein ligase RNF14 [Selaginella moellendorffii]|uniref:E3 ubiquitin-protein ligase RNF14 n=1 Tax=Selaginella moellendorffii TaxID=88036 RepID=UPI000D1CB451|nr:E3 ubiquitin-protein ligase RNF14 [Selaginella moellendorffii]|eukprot:XP_024523956.1 E3 ubiquitin-protein ligase RNF14 [Selaginella moellendorffii]
MDRKSVSARKIIRQLAKNPEFVASGLPSPPAGSPLPLSVSPAADSLGAFASADDEISSPGSVSVRLSEFIGSRRNRRGRRNSRPMSDEKSEDLRDFGEVFVQDLEEHRIVVDSGASSSGNVHGIFASDDTGRPELEDLETMMLRKLLEQDKTEAASAIADDKISQNKQEQDDEILALEAIYEGSFKHLSKESDGDLRCFMIEVTLEAFESIEISMERPLPSSGATNRHSFTLQYLPPIHLACLLPSTYPSHSRPPFVLHAQWLSADRLIRLSDKLLEIWEDQKGEVVVYPWTEFLHSQALSAIEAFEKLELVQQPLELHDPRVISGCNSLDEDALSLLRYNEEMQLSTFLSSIHLCTICFEESTGREFIKFPCQHAYCRKCMQQYMSVHVTDGSINSLKCPDCKGGIPPSALKELLSEEDFERWEKLCLQKTLDAMSDIVYCPRCGAACIEEGDHDAQCSRCFFSFCSLCRAARHVGQECLTPEARLLILRDRGSLSEDQRKREENLVNELKNLDFVKKDAKPCPTCGMAISKSAGCNKMTCSNCGQYFCFKCGKRIDGYLHFSNSCTLFDDDDRGENAQLWQLVQQQEQRQQQRQEAIRFGKPCPSCGQPNVKVGNNNHIFCMSCQNHYCGQCHKLVRKSSEHFGPNKCKQHSVEPR